MDLNYRADLRMLGHMLQLTGLIMVLPIIVSWIYGESDCASAFFVIAVPAAAAGKLIDRFVRPSKDPIRMRDGFLVVAISWLMVSALSAVPYLSLGAVPSYADAFFEASSGYTTTGATIFQDVESLPRALLFWRSFSHWIGGMGILIFTLSLMPEMGIGGQNIAKAETPGPIFSKVAARMTDTARFLYLLYTGFTLVETLLLCAGGMSVYDALLHAFGTVGTGGFSIYNDSIAHFDSPYIEGVITVFMLLSGASFNLYFLVAGAGLKAFRRDAECRLYLLIYLVATMLVALKLSLVQAIDFSAALRQSSFQVASLLTTTGYATADYTVWPAFCQMTLLLLFFIGGCSASTSSGFKVIRVLVVFKALRSNLAAKLHPNALLPIQVDGRTIPTETVATISSYLFLYISTILGVGMLVSLDGHTLLESISTAATCLGNIGPAFGAFGPSANFASLAPALKYLLSFAMIVGRLELYTIVLLFARHFWNPYR